MKYYTERTIFSLLSAPATVFCDSVTLISTFYDNNNNNN